jgi:hypothetical protein
MQYKKATRPPCSASSSTRHRICCTPSMSPVLSIPKAPSLLALLTLLAVAYSKGPLPLLTALHKCYITQSLSLSPPPSCRTYLVGVRVLDLQHIGCPITTAAADNTPLIMLNLHQAATEGCQMSVVGSLQGRESKEGRRDGRSRKSNQSPSHTVTSTACCQPDSSHSSIRRTHCVCSGSTGSTANFTVDTIMHTFFIQQHTNCTAVLSAHAPPTYRHI